MRLRDEVRLEPQRWLGAGLLAFLGGWIFAILTLLGISVAADPATCADALDCFADGNPIGGAAAWFLAVLAGVGTVTGVRVVLQRRPWTSWSLLVGLPVVAAAIVAATTYS